jgi:hypothetical protein
MKAISLLTTLLLLAPTTLAQNPDCRQSWMPTDAPAFCAWETEPSLPEARTYLAVATADNQIYVLGGYRYDASSKKTIYYDSVVRSTIGANSHLSTWTPEPSFKGPRTGASAVTAGRCLFLAGGGAGITYYDDLQFARIGNDGHLSSWTTSPNHLKIPRSNHSLVFVTTDKGNYLNAVAGVAQIGQDTVHLDSVEVAKVGDDCSVGAWTLADYHVKGGRSTPQAIVVRNNVVVLGGWGDLDLIDVYSDVQTSIVRSNGSPSPWRTSSSRLTTGLYGHADVFAEPEKQEGQSLLMTVGGQPGTGAYAGWVSYAYVMPGPLPDAIGIWRIAPTGRLPAGRAGLGAAQSRARLYVFGGNDPAGQASRDVTSARFDFGRP